jgi:hypothetical protein
MFTEHASHVPREDLSAVISGFHPAAFRLMAESLADSDTRDLLSKVQSPTSGWGRISLVELTQ